MFGGGREPCLSEEANIEAVYLTLLRLSHLLCDDGKTRKERLKTPIEQREIPPCVIYRMDLTSS